MMPQTQFGQTDALALALVDWLQSPDPETPWAIEFEAERRFRLIDDLPSIPDPTQPASVDIFPDAEEGDRQGMSTAFHSQYAVHVFIQQRLTGSDDEDAQCALLTQLRSQIIEQVKLRMFDLPQAVHPVNKVFLSKIKNADKGLYNLNRLLEAHVYESDTILIFKAAV